VIGDGKIRRQGEKKREGVPLFGKEGRGEILRKSKV
jgi:hypothetical protein